MYAAIHNLEGEAMNFTKFLAPAVACCVLVTGATVFDTSVAENIFHDREIIISRGFGRVIATGKTYSLFDGDEYICNSFEQNGFSHRSSPDRVLNLTEDADLQYHRLTLTEDADLKFSVKAEDRDPVLFILPLRTEYYRFIQWQFDEKEVFHTTSIWPVHDMPAGTYLIWVGDCDDRANNYKLEIEED